MAGSTNIQLLPPAFSSDPILDKKHEKEKQTILDNAQNTALMACFLYCICSLIMTFANKVVLTSYDFKWPLLLLSYQNIFTVVFVQTAKLFKIIKVEPLQWKLVQKWLPVNVLFVAMLLSSTYTLKFLAVPMVTIFKNFTTMIITAGDFFIFHQAVSTGVVGSLLLMLFGSIVAALNDLSFNPVGYMWMAANCLISAGYILYMRLAMKGTKLSEFGNVFYNNALSIPLVIPLMLLSGVEGIEEYPYWGDPGFLFIAFVGGLSSVGISFTSFWTVRTTSPTTYSIVGSLNKIPLSIIGTILFSSPMNLLGGISIIIGLLGGVVYSLYKHWEWSAAHTNKATQ